MRPDFSNWRLKSPSLIGVVRDGGACAGRDVADAMAQAILLSSSRRSVAICSSDKASSVVRSWVKSRCDMAFTCDYERNYAEFTAFSAASRAE